jgi:hypothetical protein
MLARAVMISPFFFIFLPNELPKLELDDDELDAELDDELDSDFEPQADPFPPEPEAPPFSALAMMLAMSDEPPAALELDEALEPAFDAALLPDDAPQSEPDGLEQDGHAT